MAMLETKYSIGDVVWLASATTTRKRHPCPDCKGSGKWKAISPAGAEYEFSCPRCAAGYLGNRDLSLDYPAFAARVQRLTIGSIRLDTFNEKGVSYMCSETGVGSGTIYDEGRLFPTEELATAAAEAMAADHRRIRHEVDLQMLFDELNEAEEITEAKEIIANFKFRD